MNEKRHRIIVVGAGLGATGDAVSRMLASALAQDKDVHLLGIDNGETYRVEREVGMSHLFMHPYGDAVPDQPDPAPGYDPHRLADMSKAKPLPFYHGRRRY